jgi:hypothetical protein
MEGGEPKSTKLSHPKDYKIVNIRGESIVWGSVTVWDSVPSTQKPVAKNDGKEIDFSRNIARHNPVTKTRQQPPTPMYS